MFAGIAPTTENAKMMEQRLHLRIGREHEATTAVATAAAATLSVADSTTTTASTRRAASPSPRDPQSEVGVGANTELTDADQLLREMVHLSMGLPPNTKTTEGIAFLRRGRSSSLASSSAGSSFASASPSRTATPSTAALALGKEEVEGGDTDRLLREMVHLSMGLPPGTAIASDRFANNSPSSSVAASVHASQQSRKAPRKTAAEEAADADQLLREMVHLSMGLPPATKATDGIASQQHFSTASSEAAPTDGAAAPSSAWAGDSGDAATLREMLHLSMGLPPDSRPMAQSSGTTEEERMEEIKGLFYYLMRTSRSSPSAANASTSPSASSLSSAVPTAASLAAMREALARLPATLFPMSLGVGGAQRRSADRNSPEAVAARQARKEKAKPASGIPEEMLGF